jgi:hypothetical protein
VSTGRVARTLEDPRGLPPESPKETRRDRSLGLGTCPLTLKSGRPDSNWRLPAPKAGALARLRHAPQGPPVLALSHPSRPAEIRQYGEPGGAARRPVLLGAEAPRMDCRNGWSASRDFRGPTGWRSPGQPVLNSYAITSVRRRACFRRLLGSGPGHIKTRSPRCRRRPLQAAPCPLRPALRGRLAGRAVGRSTYAHSRGRPHARLVARPAGRECGRRRAV